MDHASSISTPPTTPSEQESETFVQTPAAKFVLVMLILLSTLGIIITSTYTPPQTQSIVDAPILLIDLNTATVDELDLLPRIGPALATRIVEHRQSEGLFSTLEDLDDVKGIGPKTIERLKPWVTLTHP